jgi:hypothetical protein
MGLPPAADLALLMCRWMFAPGMLLDFDQHLSSFKALK